MARGFPDWFGQNFYPVRGTTYRATGSVEVSGGGFMTVATVPGKGMTLGGFMYTSYPGSLETDLFAIRIDGTVIAGSRHVNMYTWGLFPPAQYSLTLTRFDNKTPYYAVNILDGLLFEQEFALEYSALDTDLRAIVYELNYTMVG